jgi:hypothetical protein
LDSASVNDYFAKAAAFSAMSTLSSTKPALRAWSRRAPGWVQTFERQRPWVRSPTIQIAISLWLALLGPAIAAAAKRPFGFELQFSPFAGAHLGLLAEMLASTKAKSDC